MIFIFGLQKYHIMYLDSIENAQELQSPKREMFLALKSSLNNLNIVTYRQLNNSGCFMSIQTHDLCDDSTKLYQLRYEATQLRKGSIFLDTCVPMKGYNEI